MKKFFNKQILLLQCFIFPVLVIGQTAISGKVVDNRTKEPVAFASVYINGSTIGTTTNDSGFFLFKEFRFSH